MRQLNLGYKPKKSRENKLQTEASIFWSLCNIIKTKRLPPEAVEVKINMILAGNMLMNREMQKRLLDLRDKNRERFDNE